MMRGLRRWGLLAPAVAAVGLLVIAPLSLMAYVSTLDRGPQGMVVWDRHSLDAYVQFLFERDLAGRWALNTDYLRIFGRSIMLAGITTVLTLLIGFPTALWMAFQPPRRRTFLVFIVTVPFWTTSIGLTYSFLPYMILPIYVSLEKLDRRLLEAAYDLGADRWRTLWRVILPLSMPGIIGGAILVFVPGLGAFISPELLGGAKSMMIGNLIQEQFGQSRNWPFGSALAFVLLALVLAALGLHSLRFKRERRLP